MKGRHSNSGRGAPARQLTRHFVEDTPQDPRWDGAFSKGIGYDRGAEVEEDGVVVEVVHTDRLLRRPALKRLCMV
jgi:hypothetical protein